MYNTDDLMLSVFNVLKEDMHASLGIKAEYVSPQNLLARSTTVSEARTGTYLLSEGMSPYQYKWCAQMNSFLKRYTFQDDIITPTIREEITNAKFIKLQEALAASYSRPRTMRCHEVIRLTRKIVRGILSKVSLDSQEWEGRFGTKATVGCPANDAYIDRKLLARPVTGSAAHIEWFKNEILPNDSLLDSLIAKNKKGYETVQCLSQVNVPKKFSIDRGINPNTLIGSLYTHSIGKLIEEALKIEGLNIKNLQVRHGKLAKKASQYTGNPKKPYSYATADLSDASHGFLSNLLNALLPREWYRLVMRGVIRQVEVAGRLQRLESIMTMGIGFTFPMQTLLFYSLLRAIQVLTGVSGIISVYGDDLIYPVDLHRFVVGIFQDLGFKLNLDKTFVHSYFKESCGSDYFKGVDVRPFALEGSGSKKVKSTYLAFCYKLVNGLLHRWDFTEVRRTVLFLLFEINMSVGEIFLVERHHPATSGVYIDSVPSSIIERYFSVARWTWHEKLFCYTYPVLSPLIPRRYVTQHTPYYWDTLRTNSHREFEWEQVLRLPEIMGTSVFGSCIRKTSVRNAGRVKVRRTHVTFVASKGAKGVTRYEVRPNICKHAE